MKNVRYLFVVLAVVALALTTSGAFAVVLIDGNSTATIVGTTDMSPWVVDGFNQLFNQSWWVRPNTPGSLAHPLGDGFYFGLVGFVQPTPDTVNFTYAGVGGFAGLTAVASYDLNGGLPGSKSSQFVESMLISNIGGVVQDLSLFEYNDFDLTTTLSDLKAEHVNNNLTMQLDETWQVQETVLHTPEHWGVAYFPTLLAGLTGTANYDFPDTISSLGAGDLTYGWEWIETGIAPGATRTFGKVKQLDASPVPEPMSMVLGMLGLGSVAGFVKLRRK